MEDMSPMLFIGLRFCLAAIVVAPLAFHESRGTVEPLTRRHWRQYCVLGTVFFFAMALQQVGLLDTTVTNAGFLTTLYVIMVPIVLLVLFRRKQRIVCLDRFAGFGTWHLLAKQRRLQPHPLGRPAGLGVRRFLGSTRDFGRAFYNQFQASYRHGDNTVCVVRRGCLNRSCILRRRRLGRCRCNRQDSVGSTAGDSVRGRDVGRTSVHAADRRPAAHQFQYRCDPDGHRKLFAAIGGAILLGERLNLVGYAGCALIFGSVLAVELLGKQD